MKYFHEAHAIALQGKTEKAQEHEIGFRSGYRSGYAVTSTADGGADIHNYGPEGHADGKYPYGEVCKRVAHVDGRSCRHSN